MPCIFRAKRAATAGCGGLGRFEVFTMWFDTLVPWYDCTPTKEGVVAGASITPWPYVCVYSALF